MTRSNFPSLVGFVSSEVKEGEGIRMYKILNCPVNNKELEKLQYIQSLWVLDNYAYPEVFRRIKNNELPVDFKLRNVHIILHSDESKNEILLNEEVRFIAHVVMKDDSDFKEGDIIKQGDIVEIKGLYAGPYKDPNTANVILFKYDKSWFYAFDLIYDRQRVQLRYETGISFLNAAKLCKTSNLFGPFIDNLYSAMELMIQSMLILRHNPKFSINQTHDDTKKLFRDYAENGNIDKKYADHYDNLYTMRKKGRYTTGLHGKSFKLKEEEMEEMISTTEEFRKILDNHLKVIDLNKNPKVGQYIKVI